MALSTVSVRPAVAEPYLPPLASSSCNYTLVIDLDETLVHYKESSENEVGHFLVRPYAQQFILEMSEFYELVVFTAAVQEYADWILDLIDPQKCIAHRLYRQHCLQKNNVSIKDLSKLGRDIRKTIIIDNLPENF